MRMRSRWLGLCLLVSFVAACGSSGSISSTSTPSPQAPSGIQATAADGSVTLAWDRVEGATSYTLYFKESAGVSKSDTALTRVRSPYTHTGRVNGATYYYAVSASNDAGESVLSTEVSAQPMPTLPSAPSNVTAVANNGQVTLSWSPVNGAVSYNIYWSTTAGITTASSQIPGATSPYVHTGRTNDTLYFYKVSAVNLSGESALSEEVSATPSAVPAGLAATAQVAQIRLSWVAVEGATSYNLYFATTPGVTKTSTALTGASSPYTHASLAADTQYYYAVTAITPAGESALSREVSTWPLPSAPQNVVATPGDATVRITWNSVVGATSYRLYFGTIPGVTPATGTLINNVTSPYLHTPASITTLYYVVVAVNAAGSGPASAEASALARPGTPANVTGGALPPIPVVSWDAVDGASTYKIYYSQTPGFTPDDALNLLAIYSGPPPRITFQDLPRSVGIYYYIIAASNLSGDGVPTSEVAVTINLVAFVSSTSGSGNIAGWTAANDTGLQAADAICNQDAAAADFAGTFVAWLSDNTSDAYCRLHGLTGKLDSGAATCGGAALTQIPGPWARTDGMPFGDTLGAMLTGEVYTTPRYDETGALLDAAALYFTGTSVTGGLLAGTTCTEWTDDGSTTDTSVACASVLETGTRWAGHETFPSTTCGAQGHLLCMQTLASPIVPALPPVVLPPTFKMAFVTSATYNGNLATFVTGNETVLDAADRLCQTAAQGNLPNPTRFRAWLSTSTVDAIDRFVDDGVSWIRSDGIPVALDLDDLASGDLFAPLNVNETGAFQSGETWTGTTSSGERALSHCANWTNGDTAQQGWGGSITSSGSEWTYYVGPPCNELRRLYCFEDGLPL